MLLGLRLPEAFTQPVPDTGAVHHRGDGDQVRRDERDPDRRARPRQDQDSP